MIRKFFSLFILFACTFILFQQPGMAQDSVLNVDIRHRPPEMIVKDNNYSGPLIDIITEAAQKSGYQVKLEFRQFKKSLSLLKQGELDILPRTICTAERAAAIDYLGPIGYQQKDIVFIVRKGQENLIKEFDDLRKPKPGTRKKLKVGCKAGTYYFEEFNNSTLIRKIETMDDNNLVGLFAAERFDAFIALDKKSADAALKKYGVTDYAYAKYKHTKLIGNYFGIAQNHNAYKKLQTALEQMVLSGRIKAIYKTHKVKAPVFKTSMGFKSCTK